MTTLPAFTQDQSRRAKLLLATQVASMMGRKLEEGDWSKVYCKAKNLPEAPWSNLHIDVNHNGFGLELKNLRIGQLAGRTIKAVCGTTLMHPSATRSIRVEDISAPAEDVMRDVFRQYRELIEQRTARVRAQAPEVAPDMRTGWLLWEDNLTEFLYFEEPMAAPNADNYYATWNVTPARGVRKESKSLWVFDKNTSQKRYSITTSAGIKIQPYFDVPPPDDPNLSYFRVQSEPVGEDTVLLWVASSTAEALKRQIGSLERDAVSKTVLDVIAKGTPPETASTVSEDLAVGIPLTIAAHSAILTIEGVSDEHRAQLLLKALAA